MRNKIKWGCIQPLTGGMYIGTRNAVGHPAEWILSYKGLDKVSYDKEGNITVANNEYNLKEYLKKHNEMPPYYCFERNMFNTDISDMNPVIVDEDDNAVSPDYSDMDLVVAVPVCSGLSTATIGSDEVKYTRNCNMLYLAKYTLNVIKPKMYIFENAPTLMTSRGDELRSIFEQMGRELNYDIIYYRTDTNLHHNCQHRVRTFVTFVKKDAAHNSVPVYGYENAPMSIEDFFNAIPKDLTQQDDLSIVAANISVLAFIKEKYGDDWKNKLTNPKLLYHVIRNNMLDELIEFTDNYKDTLGEEKHRQAAHYLRHVKRKLGMNAGWFGCDIAVSKDHLPAIAARSIPSIMHPFEDRPLNIRELLECMGMPHDFELCGNRYSNYRRIGQNVPVKTAEFIASEAVKVLNNWNDCECMDDCNAIYINNIKQKIERVA